MCRITGYSSEIPLAPRMVLAVRQISGLIARRIVCRLRPGESVDRGEPFGMIKLGSRTELIVPREDGLALLAAVGQMVPAERRSWALRSALRRRASIWASACC